MTKQTDRLTPGQYTALTNLHHSASTTSLFFASVDYETSIQLLTDRWVRITEEGFVYLTQAGDKARIAESDTRFEEETRPTFEEDSRTNGRFRPINWRNNATPILYCATHNSLVQQHDCIWGPHCIWGPPAGPKCTLHEVGYLK
jgi:hypothetical protein